MPYRIDLEDAPDDAFERLADLGALDVEVERNAVAAILPDAIAPDRVARVLGRATVAVSPARGRDGDSVWVVRPRAHRVGRLQIVPADGPAEAGALRMADAPAFGTGWHPTTALCLEALERELSTRPPASVLDVGTGSGVLALAALLAGVPQAVGVDVDAAAIRAAAANARLNGLSPRLRLLVGGPEALEGAWPLVVANILAAPLMDMAPTLVRRVGSGGRAILSGVRDALQPDVERAYQRLGMHPVLADTRAGWTALTFQASW